MIFLARHPGWTWRDLQDAPDEIVEAMRLLDRKLAEMEQLRQAHR